MFGARHLYFSISKLNFKTSPLVFMSPRGLISILLFLQLEALNDVNLKTNIIDERVLLLVILLSMLIMLLGTLKKRDKIKDIPLEIEIPINEDLNTDYYNDEKND